MPPAKFKPAESLSTRFSGLTLGSGLRFLTEGTLLAQFTPFGFKLKSFRYFMTALGVPYLITPSGIRLYSLYTVFIALQAISTIGAKPFVTSGIARNRASPKSRPDLAFKLDASHIQDFEALARSIILASDIFKSTKDSVNFTAHIRAAAAHLATLNLVVTRHQKAADQLAKEKYAVGEIPDTGPLPAFPPPTNILDPNVRVTPK